MLTQITGLHHITSFASDARENNNFFTKIRGLRRSKKQSILITHQFIISILATGWDHPGQL